MAAARQMMEGVFPPPRAQLPHVIAQHFTEMQAVLCITAGYVGITSGTAHGNADDNSCQLYWGLLLKCTLRQH